MSYYGSIRAPKETKETPSKGDHRGLVAALVLVCAVGAAAVAVTPGAAAKLTTALSSLGTQSHAACV